MGHIRRLSRAGLMSTTASSRKMRGMDLVMKNLNAELAKMRLGSAAGLIEAAEFIHADTERTPPLTPVDTGKLRSSWSTRFFRREKKSVIIFGYSANYALYVHEMIGPVNWTRQNSGAKWFEYAIKRNVNRVLYIIAGRTKVKG
jgi:hypothetical protein